MDGWMEFSKEALGPMVIACLAGFVSLSCHYFGWHLHPSPFLVSLLGILSVVI